MVSVVGDVEAMGQGVPVICPDIPLYREFVDPARNILLNPGRPVADQLAGIDLKPYRAIKNRRALAKETQAKYGREKYKEWLAEMLG